MVPIAQLLCYRCGTSEASEQQHNQDLREKLNIGYEKSRFDRFLPEFTAPRTHLEPEFTAPRTYLEPEFTASACKLKNV